MSSPGYWQTGCSWREAVESWFHLDLKSLFALNNNFLGFLLGHITRWINIIYGSWMKWTWHHSKFAIHEVKFLTQTHSGTPSTIIYTRWSSWHGRLECHAPMVVASTVPPETMIKDNYANKYLGIILLALQTVGPQEVKQHHWLTGGWSELHLLQV